MIFRYIHDTPLNGLIFYHTDNTTISERNSADNLYDSSTPCNITSRKETKFIDPGSVNATIELRCPIDECVSVSDIVWYHNGEEMSASEVSGNATQLYGVYQCFVSSNGGHSVEASITRVLPHGMLLYKHFAIIQHLHSISVFDV